MYPSVSLFRVTAFLNALLVHWGCSPRSSQFVRPALEPGVLGINSVENGIFLDKILHGLFRQGRCAFLKVRKVDINFRKFLNLMIFRRLSLLWTPPTSLGLRQVQCHPVASHCIIWHQTLASIRFRNVTRASSVWAYRHYLLSSLTTCLVLLPINAGAVDRTSRK